MRNNTYNGIRTLIYKCDIFSQKIGFRFKQESQYSTLTGGVMSILLIITFFVVFASTILSTLNKESITTQAYETVQQDPSQLKLSLSDNFFFGLGLSGVDMNNGIRYFDIQMTYTEYNLSGKFKTSLNLVPCNHTVWTQFNTNSILEAYSQIGMDQWLCPQQSQVFKLKGKFTSQDFQFIKIGVKKCNTSLSSTRPCATSAQISSFLSSNSQFSLNIYFVNALLNPSQKVFVSHYLQDRYYFPFTLDYGLTTNLFFSDYQIKTDESIWPNQNQNITKGGILSNSAQIFPTITTGTEYLKLYFRKAGNSLKYTRTFRKIDDTLSYIGGLFSTIVCFLLIVGLYNEYSYELQIAKNIYKYDEQTLLDTNKFHFFSYLLYLIYSFLTLIDLQPKWSQMEHYHESLKQVRKQMDIRLIFKKLFFIQKFANIILDESQLKGLHLQQKITMKKAQQIRQNYLLPKLLADNINKQINIKLQQQKAQNQVQSSSQTSEVSIIKKQGISRNMSDELQISSGLGQANYNLQMIIDQIKETQLDKDNRNHNRNRNNNNDKKQVPKIKKTNSHNLKRLKTMKAIKDAITNSVYSIKQIHNNSHKQNKTYTQIINIIKQLKDKSLKENPYSKKILQKISPQIKQLLNIQNQDDIQVQDSSQQCLYFQRYLKEIQKNRLVIQGSQQLAQNQKHSIKDRKYECAKSVKLKSIKDIIAQNEAYWMKGKSSGKFNE